jgi:hypothetical protein
MTEKSSLFPQPLQADEPVTDPPVKPGYPIPGDDA